MNIEDITQLLKQFKNGEIGEGKILESLKSSLLQSMDIATVDHHRELRQGFPEVIFCEGKSPEQVLRIARQIYGRHKKVLATRADQSQYNFIKDKLSGIQFNEKARCLHSPLPKVNQKFKDQIAVVTAGTSDIPVAEEAALTCHLFGFPPIRIYDVGVAGLHRLNHHWKKMEKARVLIVIAGMEGALSSVIGGLVDKPVIAVPTSVGYGTSLGGMTALFSMLNSCASNVTVVNIDNGFGAGFSASLIIRQIFREDL